MSGKIGFFQSFFDPLWRWPKVSRLWGRDCFSVNDDWGNIKGSKLL